MKHSIGYFPQSYHLYFTSKEIVLIIQVEAPSVARATIAVAGCVEADSGSVNKFLVLEMPHISTISRDPAAVFIFYMTVGPHRLQQPRPQIEIPGK